MVMRARSNVYHLECFACQQCNHRLCVGDCFYPCENKILCEYDYEERMVFANMACSPGSLSLLRSQGPDSNVSNHNSNPSQVETSAPLNNTTNNSTSSPNIHSISPKFQSVSPTPLGSISALHSHHHQANIVSRPVT
ncbi:unnamed protein product [Orchesella dallaii]|uniref:LIM zinc-binding domain-containing protein n=1 Tax=Orchesella dallaii TaxID=48710 RepID=A0ABP1R2J6_9HEXA